MSKIQQIDTIALTISPKLDRILMLSDVNTDEAREEFAAGLASVRKLGKVRVPIKVQEGTTQVVDGRHRLAWAREAGLATVPVEFVSESEAWETIRSEIFARRSMTKGQKAWLHLVLVPEIATRPEGRPKLDTECPVSAITTEEAAAEAGVSHTLMKDAKALHRILTTQKRFTTGKHAAEARRAVEERIFAGEGLGQIVADLRDAPNSRKPDQTEPLDPHAEAEARANAAEETFTALLDQIGTEVDTTKTYADLRDLPLHLTTTRLLTFSRSMALAAMARPGLTASQKQQLLTEARDAYEALKAAASAVKIGK